MTRDGSDRLERSNLAIGDFARALLVMKTMKGDDPLSVSTAADLFNATAHFVQGTVREFSDGALFLAGPNESPGTQYIEVAAPSPTLDAALPANQVRADGGCIACDADAGEAHRPGCPRAKATP